MPDQVEILNSCLQAIESGESTLEECIARYPEVKGLAALLRLATAVRQQDTAVKMPEVRKIALERRLIQVMQTRQPRRSQIGLRLLAGLAALMILATLSGIGLARIAQYAVPGDPLYGYKRVVESAELRFAGAAGQSPALENIANARFHEIEVLAVVRHEVLDASYLADVAQSVQAAAQTDPALRDTLYKRYQELLNLADKDGLIKPDVLGTAIAALLSPTPTLTLTPTFTASATQTASPTVRPTLSPTATLTYTPIERPTLTAVDTATPIPPTETATNTLGNTANVVALPTTTPAPPRKLPSATSTFTAIPTIMLPTSTSTPLPGQPLVPVHTATLPPTNTATFTATATPITPSATLTASKTATHPPTKTSTPTKSFTATMTFTYAACPSMTPTFTATPKGFKASPTTVFTAEASVPCLTWTPTPIPTDTPVPTNTLEPRHPSGTQAATAAATASIETEAK